MYIERLETRNFRNLLADKVELSQHTVLFRGDNGQGKTNVLEALYVCATGKSFRQSPYRDLVRHGEERAKVSAQFNRQEVRHDIDVELKAGHKNIHLDGRGLRKTSSLLNLLNVVAFFPDDLRIVKGSPEERRRFLDRAVANHEPQFVDIVQGYTKVLKERNALLKSTLGRSVDATLLDVLDEQLVKYGVLMHERRRDTLRHLAPLAQARFEAMMHEGRQIAFGLSMGAATGTPEEDIEFSRAQIEDTSHGSADLNNIFLSALQKNRTRDRARGLTSVGPHRADMLMFMDGYAARAFASQGQQRAVVLALKLAEVTRLRELLGCAPILLLDDVSSELDSCRTVLLFEEIQHCGGQVFISSTGATDLPLSPLTQIFRVEKGKLSLSL